MADIIRGLLKGHIHLENKVSRLICAATIYVIILEFRNHRQKKEIKALRDELKELKHVEGE
jgi:hypothetical protein